MNILDIALIILSFCCLVAGFAYFFWLLGQDESKGILACTIVLTVVVCFSFLIPFIVIDKGAGSTMGEITSVDKNFFGTTAVYIKTSETNQEKYCIENENIALKAQDLIGKKVRVYYGERVGLYSTGKCSIAPIDKLIEVENYDRAL